MERKEDIEETQAADSKAAVDTKKTISKGKKAVKIAAYAVLAVVTALVLAVCAISIYTAVRKNVYGDELPSVFGVAAATVATGSMEPEISAGDLIIIKAYDTYAQGDVITFYDSSFGGYVTHRIVEEKEGGFVTKGDANNVADTTLVTYSVIKGKVICVVGGAGNVISFLQTPIGIICMAGGVIIIWLLADVVVIFVKKAAKKDDE